MTVREDAEKQLIEIGQYLEQKGLVTALEGNLSARLSEETFLITKSATRLGQLTREDFVVCDLNGQIFEPGRPSSEFRIHLVAYQMRKDCNCVVHSHPKFATASTLVKEPFLDNLLIESAAQLGPVIKIPYGQPGTTELSDLVSGVLPHHKTILLAHHGAMTLGSTCWDACYRMDILERVAEMIWIASNWGELLTLPVTDQEFVKSISTGKLS